MDQTQQDAANEKYFNSGWEGALREVIAVAKHQGDAAAVAWAKEHHEIVLKRQEEKA